MHKKTKNKFAVNSSAEHVCLFNTAARAQNVEAADNRLTVKVKGASR